MNLLKSWRFWLGCIISLLCLWFAFRKVPLAEVIQALAGANPLFLLAAFILQAVAVVSRAPRWLVLLDKRSGFANSFWAQSVGFLFTNVFPFRLGEPARVLVMSDRCRLPVMQVTASAIVERLLDVAANVIVLILVLPRIQMPALMKQAGMVSGALVLTGLGFCLSWCILDLRARGSCNLFAPACPCFRRRKSWRSGESSSSAFCP